MVTTDEERVLDDSGGFRIWQGGGDYLGAETPAGSRGKAFCTFLYKKWPKVKD